MSDNQPSPKQENTVKIEYKTTWNRSVSQSVPASQAEAIAERLKTMPDIKTETVTIKW